MDSSAEGAATYQPGATPQEGSCINNEGCKPESFSVLRQCRRNSRVFELLDSLIRGRSGFVSRTRHTMDHRIALPLEEKTEISKQIVRKALAGAQKPILAFSGGKKSVVLLHLARQQSPMPLQVLCIRTGDDFEEMLRFAEKLRKLWHMDLCMEPPEDGGSVLDPHLCCRPKVAATLQGYVKAHGCDCLLLGNTFDEARPIEIPACEVPCINPLFHLTGKDIRDYLSRHKVPRCSLYDAGYDKIDCRRCTPAPTAGEADGDKAQAEKLIKEKLKRLGYL